MAQAEVVKFLEKNPNKWFTSKEIATVMKLSRSTTTTNLKRLSDQGVIKKKRERNEGNYNILLYKITTKKR
jgi:DNA-binding MarR family transcriptional regulator